MPCYKTWGGGSTVPTQALQHLSETRTSAASSFNMAHISPARDFTIDKATPHLKHDDTKDIDTEIQHAEVLAGTQDGDPVKLTTIQEDAAQAEQFDHDITTWEAVKMYKMVREMPVNLLIA